MKIFDIRQNDLSIRQNGCTNHQNGCTNRQNTLANSGEPKYIKNAHKGNLMILIFSKLLKNARLFNFIGQSFLLNNTKIFDIRQNTLANSGEPEYIKNTRKGNLMTFDKLLNLVRTVRFFGQSSFSENDLTTNFLSIII